MANPEHLAILKQGVEQWNKWRKENPGVVPDLRGAELRKADLHGANLEWSRLFISKLERANLHEARLSGADSSGADFTRANLTGAHLTSADLTLAKLIGSNLSGANLRWTNLSRAKLTGADFSGAEASETVFANVDLSAAAGLDLVYHSGPSTIGIDTIYKSHGKIPEVFLRGCGMPDEFIAYIGSMVGRPIEFYSCFISYSTLDQEFADRLYADLQAKGVRCWFAPHDMHYGKKIHEQIDEAIRVHDKLLLILSEHSMASEWVKSEIAGARKREAQEKRQMLFPVALVKYDPVIKEWECFDADRGKDSAREIREYLIPDFSEWKNHDAYQKALGKLVGDLKATGNK